MRILIITNVFGGLYNFRRELVEKLASENELICALPDNPRKGWFDEIGCRFIEVPTDRRGTNPLTDYKLYKAYRRLIRELKPDVVLTYTIKPNIYGGLAANREGVPYIANVTGLGSALASNGILRAFLGLLYRKALRNASCVFFQNLGDLRFFRERKLLSGKYRLIPGSGVNLVHFHLLRYPEEGITRFTFISRIIKEKGIDLFLEAASTLRAKHDSVEFHVCGRCEDPSYETILSEFQNRGIIKYHGPVKDVRLILEVTHCTVHPTYYPEGMSNVLLESAASGRPVITTDRDGCREIVNDGTTGFLVKLRDTEDLIKKMEDFLLLDKDKRRKMGLAGRMKAEREFDRNIVIDAYIEEIERIRLSKDSLK